MRSHELTCPGCGQLDHDCDLHYLGAELPVEHFMVACDRCGTILGFIGV